MVGGSQLLIACGVWILAQCLLLGVRDGMTAEIQINADIGSNEIFSLPWACINHVHANRLNSVSIPISDSIIFPLKNIQDVAFRAPSKEDMELQKC